VPTRIIPGAVSTESLRALVLTDASARPALTLEALRGGPVPALRLREHASGDSRIDQHIRKAGLTLYVCEADGLRAGADYQLRAPGERPVHIKTFPAQLPSGGLSIALASCYYEAFGRHQDYLRLLQSAPSYGPLAAKLLVGDNIYVDVGAAPGQARSGPEETVNRYLQYYWRSGYADVLSYLPTFCLWDDHELWNNFPEWQVHLARSMNAGGRDAYAAAGLGALKLFQAALNPPPIVRAGLSYQFEIPPVSCFALDLRAGRTSMKSADPRMTSEAELAAFERWAADLKAPGILVLGQPLWMPRGNWMDYQPPDYPREYSRIWRALTYAPYDILVLSGDVHHSRLLELDVARDRKVWELVSSPACMIPTIESIGAGTFDVQDRGSITFPLAYPGGPSGPPDLRAYHMGTEINNTIAFIRLTPADAGGIKVTACFMDLLTKVITRNQRPRVAAPLASPQPEWCQTSFTLKKRA
jgi:hypothetical protein